MIFTKNLNGIKQQHKKVHHMSYSKSELPKKPTQERNVPTVTDYLKRRDERAALPGKITTEGKMLVYYNGEWVEGERLDELLPPIAITNFWSDRNNCDRRNLWQL
jgi:hypothetical protein